MKKAFMNAFAAVTTAVLSGIILYETVITNNIFKEIGLVGIFLASLFSHLTVIGRGIFGPTFLLLTPIYHPIILGSFAAWGGAIGEITTYYLGSAIQRVGEEDTEDDFKKWIRKYGLILILVLAATPLPDTPIILLAGTTRFPLLTILLIEGVGKTVFYSLGATFGGHLFSSLTNVVGGLVSSTIIVTASITFCVLISWETTRRKIVSFAKKILERVS